MSFCHVKISLIKHIAASSQHYYIFIAFSQHLNYNNNEVMTLDKLGIYLRYLRELNLLSMHDVYLHTKITDSKLSRIENQSIKEPSPKDLKKLALLYKVDVIDVFKMAGFIDEADLLNYQKAFNNTDFLISEEKELIQLQIDYFARQRNVNER